MRYLSLEPSASSAACSRRERLVAAASATVPPVTFRRAERRDMEFFMGLYGIWIERAISNRPKPTMGLWAFRNHNPFFTPHCADCRYIRREGVMAKGARTVPSPAGTRSFTPARCRRSQEPRPRYLSSPTIFLCAPVNARRRNRVRLNHLPASGFRDFELPRRASKTSNRIR